MRKKSSIKFYLIIFSILFSFEANSSNKIKISNVTSKRITDYLDQSFFSVEINTQVSNITTLFFYISNDGNFSAISFCPSFYEYDCNLDHLKFQTRIRCQKISNQKCKLLFNRKSLYFNDKIYKKFSKDKIEDFFLITKEKVENSKKFFSDISAKLISDTNNEGWDQ
mgnify:CR=1 FL=1